MLFRLCITKNHYRLVAADLSRQKKLNSDTKAVKHIEFVAKLQKLDDHGNATNAAGIYQSMSLWMNWYMTATCQQI